MCVCACVWTRAGTLPARRHAHTLRRSLVCMCACECAVVVPHTQQLTIAAPPPATAPPGTCSSPAAPFPPRSPRARAPARPPASRRHCSQASLQPGTHWSSSACGHIVISWWRDRSQTALPRARAGPARRSCGRSHSHAALDGQQAQAQPPSSVKQSRQRYSSLPAQAPARPAESCTQLAGACTPAPAYPYPSHTNALLPEPRPPSRCCWPCFAPLNNRPAAGPWPAGALLEEYMPSHVMAAAAQNLLARLPAGPKAPARNAICAPRAPAVSPRRRRAPGDWGSKVQNCRPQVGL
jgi:hypothetical protein